MARTHGSRAGWRVEMRDRLGRQGGGRTAGRGLPRVGCGRGWPAANFFGGALRCPRRLALRQDGRELVAIIRHECFLQLERISEIHEFVYPQDQVW